MRASDVAEPSTLQLWAVLYESYDLHMTCILHSYISTFVQYLCNICFDFPSIIEVVAPKITQKEESKPMYCSSFGVLFSNRFEKKTIKHVKGKLILKYLEIIIYSRL